MIVCHKKINLKCEFNLGGKYMKLRYLAFVAGLFLTTSAWADCREQRTQTDINLCFAKQYKQEDKKLNQIYNSYAKTLDKADKKLLVAAQRGWVSYKEKDCELSANGYKGGSIYSQLVTQCLIEKTQVRTKELNILKNCNLASSEAECQ